jgi:hypothetical protein
MYRIFIEGRIGSARSTNSTTRLVQREPSKTKPLRHKRACPKLNRAPLLDRHRAPPKNNSSHATSLVDAPSILRAEKEVVCGWQINFRGLGASPSTEPCTTATTTPCRHSRKAVVHRHSTWLRETRIFDLQPGLGTATSHNLQHIAMGITRSRATPTRRSSNVPRSNPCRPRSSLRLQIRRHCHWEGTSAHPLCGGDWPFVFFLFMCF